MELYNLGMTGAVIQSLLNTVKDNAGSWSQGATISTQALQYTAQTLGESQQDQARLNIDAQKKILQYAACTATTTTTSYTGFAIGTMGADMSTTTNFGIVLGVPNFWDTVNFEQDDVGVTPSAPGFGAVAFGAGIATGRFSVALGGGNSPVQSTDWSTLPITCLAEGPYSLAGGTHSYAKGRHSFAFGNQTFTSDTSTIAIGDHAVALKRYSIAMGNGVTANGEGQFVRGRRNYALGNGWIDIVGYGTGYTGFTSGNRKNIYTLSTSGNLHIRGNLFINDTTSACTNGGSLVATQNWVKATIASPHILHLQPTYSTQSAGYISMSSRTFKYSSDYDYFTNFTTARIEFYDNGTSSNQMLYMSQPITLNWDPEAGGTTTTLSCTLGTVARTREINIRLTSNGHIEVQTFPGYGTSGDSTAINNYSIIPLRIYFS